MQMTRFVCNKLSMTAGFEPYDVKTLMSMMTLPSLPSIVEQSKLHVRRPGVEPGSTAWKATMLTVTPPTLPQRAAVKSESEHQGDGPMFNRNLFSVLERCE